MRIAHIDTERTWRGGEQQALSLIEGLKARGHENLLIARAGGALAERAKNVAPIMEVRPFGEWDFITPHFVNRRLKADRIDVVHAHTGHGVSLAAVATLGTKIPVVITRRVDFPLSQNIFSKWKYRRANRVVAISSGVRSVLVDSGIPPEKISVVPSGVDFRKYSTVSALTKPKMGFPADCLLIGQVAALAPHKDQNNFLEAIARLRKDVPNARAIIVGEGELRAALENKIAALGLNGIVRLAGFQHRPLDFLAGFDAFCLSSKEEGLGTSIIDAMALKIPVVATNVGGVPDLVEDRQTGYLAAPRSPESLAAALKTCLQSTTQNPALVENAAEKAKKFDISHTIARMEALYSELSTELST